MGILQSPGTAHVHLVVKAISSLNIQTRKAKKIVQQSIDEKKKILPAESYQENTKRRVIRLSGSRITIALPGVPFSASLAVSLVCLDLSVASFESLAFPLAVHAPTNQIKQRASACKLESSST